MHVTRIAMFEVREGEEVVRGVGEESTVGLLGRVGERMMTESTTGLPQIAQEGAGGGVIPLMEVIKKSCR